MFAIPLALCLLIVFIFSATDLFVCSVDAEELNEMGIRKKS